MFIYKEKRSKYSILKKIKIASITTLTTSKYKTYLHFNTCIKITVDCYPVITTIHGVIKQIPVYHNHISKKYTKSYKHKEMR